MKISASILSANFGNLANEVQAIEKAGADIIHIDVMDGVFVPNITIGPCVIKHIRTNTNLPIEVHLMISEVEKMLPTFLACDVSNITFHLEAAIHSDRIIHQIKESGKTAGIAINPSTSPNTLEYLMDTIDLILVMSVNPGFSGQKFITNQIEKIKKIDQMIEHSKRRIELSVDGGVNPNNCQALHKAGATILVAGSAIFTKDINNYAYNINKLKGETT